MEIATCGISAPMVNCAHRGDSMDFVQYNNQYKRENYDRVLVLLPKGRGIQLKMAAVVRGLSVSQLVTRALEAQYNLDLSKTN